MPHSEPIITSLPSLLEIRKMAKSASPYTNTSEQLFYTCPQCGHGMMTKKCKIVCYHCHYFIGCVE